MVCRDVGFELLEFTAEVFGLLLELVFEFLEVVGRCEFDGGARQRGGYKGGGGGWGGGWGGARGGDGGGGDGGG